MDILRFITAGNVDDGKSTLIGRLLYDTGNINDDIISSLHKEENINLAHITDGLRSERELGITIDIAYKYFNTKNRKYIIIDAPGHFQYTKNLVTGASNADVLILLIDAKNGITTQTQRHSLVAAFLGIKNIIVAVNKMDAVNYSKTVYDLIKKDYSVIAAKLKLPKYSFIPISALNGDNVTYVSTKMGWYNEPTLFELLESKTYSSSKNNPFRFIVQNSILHSNEFYYTGKIVSGNINIGDEVVISPDNFTTRITAIYKGSKSIKNASSGESISFLIDTTVTLQRGAIFSKKNDTPFVGNTLNVSICWMDTTPMDLNKVYLLQINNHLCRFQVGKLVSKTNPETLEEVFSDLESLKENEFANAFLILDKCIVYDYYNNIPECGRGIIINPDTNYTCAALVIRCIM